jgi:hypothetical protein
MCLDVGSFEHHNECLGSIKDREYLFWVTNSFSRSLHHGVGYLGYIFIPPLVSDCKSNVCVSHILFYTCELRACTMQISPLSMSLTELHDYRYNLDWEPWTNSHNTSLILVCTDIKFHCTNKSRKLQYNLEFTYFPNIFFSILHFSLSITLTYCWYKLYLFLPT